MNRSLLLILLGLSTFLAKSQGLTRAQVYGFDIGDIFQTEYSSSTNLPPIYYTLTILGKTPYPDGDSVSYMIHSVTYAPYSGPSQTTVVTYNDYSRTYTTLSDLVWEWQNGSDCQIEDTLYTSSEFCGRSVWKNYTGDFCVGPTYYWEKYVEGCGGPYYSSYNDGSNQVSHRYLIYYKKGDIECGTLNANATGITEINGGRFRLSAYPVPAVDRITLEMASLGNESSSGPVHLTITDLLARTLKSLVVDATKINGLQLDVHELPAGTYLLNLSVEGRILTWVRLVKS